MRAILLSRCISRWPALSAPTAPSRPSCLIAMGVHKAPSIPTEPVLPLLSARPPFATYGAAGVRHLSDSAGERDRASAPRRSVLGWLRGAPASNGDEDADGEQKVHILRLLEVARPERALIALAMGAQVVSAGSTMVFPLALGRIVDAVQAPVASGAAAVGGLDTLVLAMGGVFTLASFATALRVSVLSLAGTRVSRALRTRLFEAILRQETEFFDRRQSGELTNRLSSDVSAVSRTLTDNLAKLVRAGITCTTSLGLVLYLSPKLSLVALAAFPPIILFAVLFGRNARRLSRELVDALAAATQVAAERIGAIRTVRVFGAERIEAGRYSSRVGETYELARKVAVADGLYAGSLFYSAQMSLLGVLWFGGKMVADPLDPMTVGALTSFAMYSVQLGVSISSIGSAYGQLSRALGSGHRVFEVIDRKPTNESSSLAAEEIAKGVDDMVTRSLPSGYDSTVRFDNVHFQYPTKREAAVLNGASFTVPPGKITAVAGGSGSGKSTLAALLMRLYEPDAGKITLGGTPVTGLDPRWLRRQIAMVPQEPVLFNGTVADNIRYAAGDVDMGAVIQAARTGASHDMIMGLPNGYDTMVGERGESLSGGQRARVALCRALVRKPRVLVLDEHSAALDAESERAVAHAVTAAARERGVAVLIIAHRLSSLRRADQVVFLSAGHIAEQGHFDELVARPDSMLRNMLYASEDVDDELP